MSTFRNPNNLPTKVCVVCHQSFTWRKKWERCWDEVSTCSKRCNGERKKNIRMAENGDESDEEPTGFRIPNSKSVANQPPAADACEMPDQDTCEMPDQESPNADRKAARKAAKALKRANREGRGDPTVGQKPCALCARKSDLLVRCQHDASGSWNLVCGKCWNLDSVAGGVVDGSGCNPHYRYGGLWKNLRKQSGGKVAASPSEQQLLSGAFDGPALSGGQCEANSTSQAAAADALGAQSE